jgi:hypothetical protein
LALFLSAFVVHAKDLSLEETRATLVGQPVVVLGSAFGGYGSLSNLLVEWYLVKGDETAGFKRISVAGAYAPAEIVGKRGKVISVEESQTSLRPSKVGQTDAFGKPIDASRVTNPYLQVIVKMDDDGLLIGTTNFFGNMLGHSIQLASRMDAIRAEVDGNLARLIGKTLYKTGYTKLLESALSLQDLLDRNKRGLALDYETRNLTPLKVVDAKFLEAGNAVVIKVELPNGASRLLFGELDYYDMEVGYKQTTLERMQISAVEKIPSKFSPKEVVAIKEGNIFRGMSEDALYWSWGYSEKTNDWGRAGKQHIYAGKQYVYVDGKVVRDWQSVK